jgi:hypothetical protein
MNADETSDDGSADLQIQWTPVGSTGRARVTTSSSGCSLTDTINLGREKDRTALAGKICAKWPGLDAEVVSNELEKAAAALPPPGKIDNSRADEGDEDRPSLLAKADALTEDLLVRTDPDVMSEGPNRCCAHPTLLTGFMSHIERIGVVGEQNLALLTYLLGTSRLLKKPLAAIVQGPKFVRERPTFRSPSLRCSQQKR